MTAAEAFTEIQLRNISLTPAYDGRVWSASVERIKSQGAARPNMEIVSATALTPIAAIRALVAKLGGTSTLVQIDEYEPEFEECPF